MANLPPTEYKDTAGVVPQGNRQDLAVEDILPNDDDDIAFHHSRVKRVEKLLVERFKSCTHLTIKKQYETTEQYVEKSVIYPIAIIDVDESYTDNNVIILDEFQKMLGIDDTTQQCVVGDQATRGQFVGQDEDG